MKKTILLAALLCGLVLTANAQVRFGVKGGLNFNKYSDITESGSAENAWKNQTGFTAGVALNVPLALGLSLQPELLYARKGATLKEGKVDYATIKMDYVEVPVNVQWGINVLFFRPFVFASPYISYAVRNQFELLGEPTESNWDDKNRFDYGVGLGAGLDIWKLQLTFKFNWGMGKVYKADTKDWNQVGKDMKNRNVEVGLALLF